MSKYKEFITRLKQEARKYQKHYTPTKEQMREYKKQRKLGYDVGRHTLRGNFHDMFQNRVVDLAEEYGVCGEKNYAVSSGFIDVIWKSKAGQNFIAIEIDTKNTRKSMQKLIECDAKYCIWVITATEFNIEEYSEFGEVELDKIIRDDGKTVHIIAI